MNKRFFDTLAARSRAGFIPVIPDIKCKSPKEGDLLKGRDPVEVTKLLAAAGAPSLSVVTEQMHFGGSLELLERIAAEIKLPILRKDFITSIEDIKISKEYGAEAVLLICAIQPFRQLAKLYEEALEIGLEPLVEAHTKEELICAEKLGAKFVGINNRNILELERDDGSVSATKLLIEYAPKDALIISESSIKTPAEAQAAIKAGADALLVGTALWQADDIQKYYISLSGGIY